MGARLIVKARFPEHPVANEIGEALQHVDAHHALAADAIAADAIEAARSGAVKGSGGEALARRVRHGVDLKLAFLLLLQAPEQQAQFCRCRLQQQRHEKIEGAKARAGIAQFGAVILRQRLNILGDLVARQHAHMFHEAEGNAAHDALKALLLLKLQQRLEHRCDMALHPFVEARLNLVAVRTRQLFVGDDRHGRLHGG